MADSREYPSLTAYNTAFLNHERTLRDPKFQGYAPDLDAQGSPVQATGGLATVFRMRKGRSSIAVKAFKEPDSARAGNYQAISRHLGKVSDPHLVQLGYLPQALYWGSERFPLLWMEWVEGESLREWVKANRRDGAALRRLADRWEQLGRSLASNRIAHGDLQHGNVLVRADGSLVLVDYDGMWVEGMAAQPPTEAGLPAYQHPGRASLACLGPATDHFSLWAVWLILRGLAAKPDLWKFHDRPAVGENILFGPDDMRPDTAPRSALWQTLLKGFPDEEVSARARALYESLSAEIEQVPDFSFDPWEAVRKASGWEEKARLAEATARKAGPVPEDLREQVEEARRRVEARKQMQAALNSGSAFRTANVYKLRQAELDGWDACEEMAEKGREACRLTPLLTDLSHALDAPGDGREIARLWAELAGAADHWVEIQEKKPEAEQWKAAVEALEALEAMEMSPRAQSAEIVEAAVKLKTAKHPHAARFEVLAQRSRRRADALGRLVGCSGDGQEADEALVAAWDEELAGWWEGEPWERRVQQASERLGRVAEALTAVRADEEEKGLGLLKGLPPRYRFLPEIRDEIKAGLERAQALRQWREATSSAALVNAFDECERRGLMGRLTDEDRQRGERARTQQAGLERLRSLPAHLRPDEADRAILAAWKEGELETSTEPTLVERERAGLAASRQAVWLALQQAARELDPDLRQLLDSPEMAGYPPVEAMRADLEEKAQLAQSRAALEAALASGELADDLDLSPVGAAPEQFAPRREQLLRLLQKAMAGARLRLVGEPELESRREGGLRGVRLRLGGWNWPSMGLGDRYCLVAAHPHRHLENSEDGRPAQHGQKRLSAGGLFVPAPEGGRLFVTVWPVLCLEGLGLKVTGPPLHAGPFVAPPPPSAGGWKGLLSRFLGGTGS